CLTSGAEALDVAHVTLRACRGFGVELLGAGAFSPESGELVLGARGPGSNGDGAVDFHDADAIATLPPLRFDGVPPSKRSGGSVAIASASWKSTAPSPLLPGPRAPSTSSPDSGENAPAPSSSTPNPRHARSVTCATSSASAPLVKH